MKVKPHKVKVRGKVGWYVARPSELTNGRQSRQYFSTLEEAEDKADEWTKDRSGVGAAWHRLDVRQQARIIRMLERVGNDISRIEAALDLADKAKPIAPRNISDVVGECLIAKQAAGVRRRYLQSLKCSTISFASSASKPIADVTSADVEAWLNGNGWQIATRRSYLTDLRTLFSFAIKRGYCSTNPAGQIQRPILEDKAPGILTVKQVRKLLATAKRHDPGLLGYLCPILFGGLRPIEAERLSKSEVGRLIEVTSAKSKTRRRRLVKIISPLEEWLDVPKVEIGPSNLTKRLRAIRKRAKTPWSHDCLRHSFCSYGVAKHGARWTSEQAGHSEAVLFTHYRELVRPQEADKYWNIKP